jgi:hypothetical protein
MAEPKDLTDENHRALKCIENMLRHEPLKLLTGIVTSF